MSKIITLPSGATATIKDPKTLLMKDRNKILSIANGEEGLMQAVSLQNGLIAVMVEEWSFDLIPPSVKVSSLDELTIKDYEALSVEALIAQEFLFPTLVDDGTNNPKVSIGNSNA